MHVGKEMRKPQDNTPSLLPHGPCSNWYDGILRLQPLCPPAPSVSHCAITERFGPNTDLGWGKGRSRADLLTNFP